MSTKALPESVLGTNGSTRETGHYRFKCQFVFFAVLDKTTLALTSWIDERI